jgi:uncharacterized protein
MDYPRASAWKSWAMHAWPMHLPSFVEQLVEPNARPSVERLFFIDVISFDWNCPKYITPRYTKAEVEEVISPLKRRIAELEAELSESKKMIRL